MKKILIFLCLIASYLFPIVSYASNNDYKPLAQQKAQQVIDACWAISEEDRSSGNTPRMRSGTLDSALCMERVFLKLISNYLFKNDPENLNIFKSNIKQLRASYGRLVWDLYNHHDGCSPSCGTMNHVVHNGAYAQLLEGLLQKTFSQIIEHNLQDDLLGSGILIDKSVNSVKNQVVKHAPTKNSSLCYTKIGSDQNKCGILSIKNTHDLFVLEGLHHEPYNKLGKQDFLHFVSIKGFITLAKKNAFSFSGTIETNSPAALNERCSEYGDFVFKKQEENIWKLNVEKTSCFGDKEVLIKVNDSQISLKIPEQYLGYWKPMSKTLAGVGIDVKSGVVFHKNDSEYYPKHLKGEAGFLRFLDNYKVFYIDNNPDSKFTNQYVYAIVKHQITPKWAMNGFDMAEDGTLEEQKKRQDILQRILQPHYRYYRFAINVPHPKSSPNDRDLGIGDIDCGLTKKDWFLPLHTHRKRIINGYCKTLPIGRFESLDNESTWYMNIKKNRL